MKQTGSSVQVVSTITGARRMGVDTEAMGHILSVLSNMYSDGNLAIVREYASNALDSHKVAGNPEPILVISPNHFSPTLTIQDFGTGLSQDEMLDIYAVYGTSTKRDTDGQIGHFGIGAKSAFTVGAQFVVTAVKNGVETVVLFALDDTGAPTVNVVSHKATLEPDGVKVEIAVKDVEGVVRAIERLFATWQPGTVLVDGVEPTHIWDHVEAMTDTDDIHIGWKNPNELGQSWTLIMGGIPYAIPPSVVNAMEYRTRTIVQTVQNSQAVVYLSVPIGAVDITPSREELRNTDKTVAAVNAMVEKFHLALGSWVTAQIADAPTLIAAMVKHDQLRRDLGGLVFRGTHAATWKGQQIPSTIVNTKLNWFHLTRKRGGGMIARREEDFSIPPGVALTHTLFITGIPERKLRSVQITARAFLEGRDIGSVDKVAYVVALPPGDTTFSLDWFTTNDGAVRTMTYDKFVADWKPAQAPSAPRGAVRYPILDGTAMTVAELKGETTVYYLTHHDRPNVNTNSDLVRQVIGTTPVVLLKSTQKAHMLVQRLPQATDLVTRVTAYAESVLRGVTQDDIDALDADAVLRSVDPTIIRWFHEVETDITHTGVLLLIDQYDRAHQLANDHGVRINLIRSALRITRRNQDTLGKSTWDVAAWDKIIDTLPLLVTYFRGHHWRQSGLGNAHALAYINMVEGLATVTPA